MKSDYAVVIPAFNAGRYLGEALNSVLRQSAVPTQIIVVNDGSTDNTEAIARSFGSAIQVITTVNRGAGPATTTGIASVENAIVAFLDADDIWHDDKMERQLGHLLDGELGVDAVIGKMDSFGETHVKQAATDGAGWHRSTLIMWTEKFRAVGAVENMSNGYGEMIDWFSRAREVGMRFHLPNNSVASRRIHSASLSYRGGAERDSDYLQAAIRALKRKKQLNS